MAKKIFRITPGKGNTSGPKKTLRLGDSSQEGSQVEGSQVPGSQVHSSQVPEEDAQLTANPGTREPENRTPYLWYGLTGFFALLALLGWFWPRGPQATPPGISSAAAGPLPTSCETNSRYGFDLSAYHVQGAVIREGTNLRNTLVRNNVPTQLISKMSRISDPDIFSWNIPKRGDNVLILSDKADPARLKHIIVELRFPRYALFDVEDTVAVAIYSGNTLTRLETAKGIVKDEHLWESVLNSTCHYELVPKMEEALRWAVDFYHVETGDSYKLLFERNLSADGRSEIGQLLGVYFEQWDGSNYAFFYEGGNGVAEGYFDEEARPMKRAFLKSPVEYGRISSPYGTRFHPIDGVEKTHFGTDYAAPEGTPILAVADGKVIIADDIPDSNNGNYVKIDHGNTYQSQYLHMSRLQAGLHQGSIVKQGAVIGFVGATGKATGPHVCFRFWKNNEQIDHLKENLPSRDPLAPAQAEAFFPFRDKYKLMLDEISVY